MIVLGLRRFCTDAAHVHSPTGGQGANTGMQDGVKPFHTFMLSALTSDRPGKPGLETLPRFERSG